MTLVALEQHLFCVSSCPFFCEHGRFAPRRSSALVGGRVCTRDRGWCVIRRGIWLCRVDTSVWDRRIWDERIWLSRIDRLSRIDHRIRRYSIGKRRIVER